jgi:hypothetical protein
MKIPAGLLFLIVLLVLLAAALVGGQIWAMTGSIAWSCVAAVVSAGLLGLCVRFLIHRLATGGRRFFGEYQGPIEEGEFPMWRRSFPTVGRVARFVMAHSIARNVSPDRCAPC